jgi:hypothetical protein
MGKFKDYLISEGVGLGDIGPKIDQMFNSPWLGNAINGAMVSPTWSNSDSGPQLGYAGYDNAKTETDLTIPSVQRQGRITTLLLTKNPIYVRLSDGTEAHFTYDEWRKIDGEPELGKTMTIIFQRHPQDWSSQHSKIDKVIVTD